MCVRTGQARIALDVGEEAVRFDNPLLPLSRSEMALPLISRGQVIGAMTIQSARPADFAQEDITVLQTMTDQLATAIENARLIEATRRRAEEMTALNELSRALTTRLDVDGVVEEAHRQISRVMDTTDFYISLYDPAKNEVTFPIEVINGRLSKTYSTMRADQGFTGYLIRTRKPLLIQNSGPDQEEKLGIENVTFSGQGRLLVGNATARWRPDVGNNRRHELQRPAGLWRTRPRFADRHRRPGGHRHPERAPV
jgi:transcriptional regulator with GAF, ATPase, and Fis domain